MITNILLLLVHMSDLKPDVFLGQGSRGGIHNVFEALSSMLAINGHGQLGGSAHLETLVEL